jgi:hypothetical protein
MAKTATATRKSIGLGFLPEESRHGFLIHIPKGTVKGDLISISEYRGDRFSGTEVTSQPAPPPSDPALRVTLDRGRWAALAPTFWEEANRRLRANGLTTAKLTKSPTKPIPVHPSLGKELCVLCWAVEEASIDDIPNALRNWEALAPEERWWLYTMTVATTGQALQKGVGWRKALRAAIADNPFVKGEGMSPKARRELLGHSQLTLEI